MEITDYKDEIRGGGSRESVAPSKRPGRGWGEGWTKGKPSSFVVIFKLLTKDEENFVFECLFISFYSLFLGTLLRFSLLRGAVRESIRHKKYRQVHFCLCLLCAFGMFLYLFYTPLHLSSYKSKQIIHFVISIVIITEIRCYYIHYHRHYD